MSTQILNLTDQIDTQIKTKVIHSDRQTVRRLIIFQHTCTPAIIFWAYLYAWPSNFGRFGQIFSRIIRPLMEALLLTIQFLRQSSSEINWLKYALPAGKSLIQYTLLNKSTWMVK